MNGVEKSEPDCGETVKSTYNGGFGGVQLRVRLKTNGKLATFAIKVYDW